MSTTKKVLLSILVVILGGGYFISSKVFFPLKYEESISKYAKQYNVDPYLIAGIIHNESSFREISRYEEGQKNGIVQVKDEVAGKWAKEMGVSNFKNKDILNTDLSIKMETWYLSKSYDKNNKKKAIESWVVRNVTEDDQLDKEEIDRRVELIEGKITEYKIFHPFLK